MDRKVIRDAMRAKRNSCSDKERNSCSLGLLKILRTQPWFIEANCIAAYLNSDGEISLNPTIEYLLEQQKTVTLPQVCSQQGQMQFCPWANKQSLVKNRYGILQPESDEIVPLTSHSLILTPLVAFDYQGNRIGMGGGYYDRLLSSGATSEDCPLIVGVAYDFQQIDQLEAEAWDVKMDAVVTDKEAFLISPRMES